MIPLHTYASPLEERVNGGTHLIGAVLAVIGTGVLIARVVLHAAASGVGADGPMGALSAVNGGASPSAMLASVIVFGLSMVLLFGASAAYHLSPPDTDIKRVFRLADHLSIYLLIAGTYTPIMIAIGEPWAIRTLAIVWGLALVGMTVKTLFWQKFRQLQVVLFLAMGWLAVMHLTEIVERYSGAFIALMVGGGALYTVGVIFYSMRKLPFGHAVWHLFVLGGAASFYGAVLQIV